MRGEGKENQDSECIFSKNNKFCLLKAELEDRFRLEQILQIDQYGREFSCLLGGLPGSVEAMRP